MIYFDNSATTKPYQEVLDTFLTVSTEYFGNPSSLHSLGVQAEQVLTKSREVVANLLQVEAKEILFTSGGTEGNNLAIRGIVNKHNKRGKHIITSTIEHPSTSETFSKLEEEGYSVTYLPVNEQGLVDVKDVVNAITQETILVSLIHVNNEVGSIQPVMEIGKVLKDYPKVFFHVDHVQGITKVPLSIKKAGIDLCTISGHKFHGLKGTGVLYVRSGVSIEPVLLGGVQELQFRAGTENVAGAAALAKALKMSMEKANHEGEKIIMIKKAVMEKLKQIEGVIVNTPSEQSAPHIINFSIPKVKPEVVIQALTAKKIYVSTKSACSSKQSTPSRILLAMGLGKARAESAIRISFSFENTDEEANKFLTQIEEIILELKEVMR